MRTLFITGCLLSINLSLKAVDVAAGSNGMSATGSIGVENPTALPKLSYAVITLAPEQSQNQSVSVRKLTQKGDVLLIAGENNWVWRSGSLIALTSPASKAPSGSENIQWAPLDMNNSGTVVGYLYSDTYVSSDVSPVPLRNHEAGVVWSGPDLSPSLLPKYPISSASRAGEAIITNLNHAYGIDDTGKIYGYMVQRYYVGALYFAGDYSDGLVWDSSSEDPQRQGSGSINSYGYSAFEQKLIRPGPAGGKLNTIRKFSGISPGDEATHSGETDAYIEAGSTRYHTYHVDYQDATLENEINKSEFYPRAINTMGRYVGDIDSSTSYWRQEGNPLEYLGPGSAQSINNQNKILVLTPENQPRLWFWQPDEQGVYNYKERKIKTGAVETWELSLGHLNDQSVLAGSAKKTHDERGNLLPPGANKSQPVMLIPAELAVDANRDGVITQSNDPINDPALSDQTSKTKPFRFWSNDDDDGAGSVGAEGVPATRHDNQDAIISNNRDLEDFARLQLYIGGLQDSFTGANPPLKLALKWKSITGTPKVRLFKQPDGQNGSDDYVRTDAAADTIRQAVAQNTPILVDGATAVDVPASYLSTLTQTNGKIYTVFEGVGEGKGQLTLVIKKADGTEIGEGPGVWLDIKNIKAMYNGPGTTFTKPADEQRQAIVFVHGWNMSPEGSRNFAETAFKRLWHRGYKGRFTYFRWNTNYSNIFDNVPVIGEAIDGYLADYNGSERVAWQSGAALKAVIDALPAGYSRNLMAHSMGNIVAGSALLSGMTVNNYALLQAAVPASCYDDRDLLKQPQSQRTYVGINVTLWENATPDDDPVAETRALAYRGRLTGNRGNLINFYLPNDDATVYAWELNNDKFKPALNYGYTRGSPPVLGGQQALWKQIGNGGSAYQVRLTDPLEAMPFADASWSKVVGAESRTGGAITESFNLNSSPLLFDTEHSAEFNRNIQQLKPFYDELLNRFKLTPNQ
jgi:pimeloyl-ACP methyl ester carboxylesterase